MIPENWLPVLGFEGLYEVSDLGRIRSLDMVVNYVDGRVRQQAGRLLQPGLNAGYPRVNLARDGMITPALVHRLVAIAFIANPLNLPEVNHLKGIKTDNRASELEWCTESGNMNHAFKTGLNRGPLQNFKDRFGKDLKTVYQVPVAKLDETGVEVEKYPSVTDALLALGKKGRDGNIQRAIKNNYKAYGYKWRYVL